MSRNVLILVENASVPRDRRVWQEAQSLLRAGYEVTVVCPRGGPGEEAAYERRDGIDIRRYLPSFATGSAGSYVREYAAALWHISKIVRSLARRRRFAVVHACNPPDLLLFAALPLKLRGTRLVFDQHDLVPELYRTRFGEKRSALHFFSRALERASFALADVAIAPNESYRAVAIERGRVKPERVFVVRNGPDAEFLAPAEPEPALKSGRSHLIAYVGVMAPQDGVDHALRALAKLRERRTDWRAVLAGDGDSLAALRRLAEDLELGDAVEFTGFVERAFVRKLLATADVCLAPEPSNPLNDVSSMIKLVEYMAMGRAVVSYDLPESRVSAAEAALYAPSGDVDAFAERIAALLDDPELRRRLGRAGRTRAETVLSWRESEAQLLAAYECALRRDHDPVARYADAPALSPRTDVDRRSITPLARRER